MDAGYKFLEFHYFCLIFPLLCLGNSLLYSSLAVEKLGGWEGFCPADGPQPRHHIRCGEKAEEKTSYRLLVFESKTPQFVGLQILLL